MKQVITAAIAFDKINFSEKVNVWNGLVRSADRLMHKLKPKDIVLFLRILNRSKERTDIDFLHKLLTILPIHVEKLRDKDLLTLYQVMIEQNVNNERLLKYFVYPRIEKRIVRFSFENYITSLNLLSSAQYEEDLVFWNDHVLPTIFNFEFSESEIKLLWDTLLRVKVNCPQVNISRQIVLVENIIKQFENLRKSGRDLNGLLLKLEKDLSLIPTTNKEKMTQSELKEAEKRLKDQNLLKQFMENVNSQTDAESKSKAAMESFNKVMEIKDWKKAKYELNVAEMDKLREAKEKRKEMRKKKNLGEEISVEGVKSDVSNPNVEKKSDVVIDVTYTDINGNLNGSEVSPKKKPNTKKSEDTE